MRVFDHIDARFDQYVQSLQDYCRQPSIAAQNIGMAETAAYIKAQLDRLGFTTRLFPLPGGYPVVYGERKGRSDKTVLFYQHYDVQPPEPLEEWTSPPFEPEIRDGRLYGRGVSDNKGDTMARLKAIEAWQEVYGELPVTVKFLIEGEEEIGSPRLAPFLREHADLLKADWCIWEGGTFTAQGQPTVTLGMKGMLYVELEARGANRDVHSSNGTIIPNPAWRLVWALASLKGPDERVRIAGFYDQVRPATPAELAYLEQLPDTEHLKEELGLQEFLLGVTGTEAVRRSLFEPTCTIDGIVGGYTGEGSKTVIGRWARAKVDFRLVPDMRPEDVAAKLRSHLDQHGFSDIEVRVLSGVAPYRVGMEAPEVELIRQTVQEVTGTAPLVLPINPGSGPIAGVWEASGANPICIGVSHEHSRYHAPDENIFLEHYRQGIKVIARLLARLGGVNPE